jgi:hypothetical protein
MYCKYLTIKESNDQLLLCILLYREWGEESCTLLYRESDANYMYLTIKESDD